MDWGMCVGSRVSARGTVGDAGPLPVPRPLYLRRNDTDGCFNWCSDKDEDDIADFLGGPVLPE